MRNLLYFVIGVLLAVNASLAFAAWPTLTAPVNVPMDVSPTGQIIPKFGGQYVVDGIRVAATSPDAITIKRTASIAVPAATAAGGKLISQVGQYVSIARPALVAGVKGLVRGPWGSIAATVLGTYMVELGFEYMADLQDYVIHKPSSSNLQFGPCSNKTSPQSLFSCVMAAYYGNSAQYYSYVGIRFNSYEKTYAIDYIDKRDGSKASIEPVYGSHTEAITRPATDADIDKMVLDFVAQDAQRAIDLSRDKQLPLPIAPVSNPPFEASPQSQESPASQPSTTQTTAADGTITRTDCTDSVIVSFAPDGTMTNNQIKRCTTTITLPDGTVKPGGTTITGQPVAPPSTGTGTETKPQVSCDQLGNCDWVKESTVTGLIDWMQETPTVEGDTSNLDKTEQFDISSQLRLGQDDFFSGGQCPQPIQISVTGPVPLHLELSYEPMCRFVLMVRPMLLALGALASLFIIFGRR